MVPLQLLAAVAVSWVSMIIGYSSAYTAPAEQSLEDDFKLSSESVSPQHFVYYIKII